MRCPKCGYISFDSLASCAKCAHDLLPLAQQLQGTVSKDLPPPFLAAALAEVGAAGGEVGEEILIDEQTVDDEADEADEALGELLAEAGDAEPEESVGEEIAVSVEAPAEATAGEVEIEASPAETAVEEAAGSDEVDLGALDLGDLGDLLPAAEPEAGAETTEATDAALDLGLDLDFTAAQEATPAADDEVMDLDSLLDLAEAGQPAAPETPAASVSASDDMVLTLDTDEAPLGSREAPEAPPKIADLGLSLESEDDK